MSHASTVLVGLLAQHGVTFDDFAAPLEERFRLAGDMPRRFRSETDPPSMAGSNQSDADRIAFPDALPYVAGFYTGGNVSLTALALSPAAVWYANQGEASVRLKGMVLPDVLVAGMRGHPVSSVIDHPALTQSGETVIAAHQNGSDLNLRLTNTMRAMERADTRLHQLERLIGGGRMRRAA